jgi:superfamily II DNA/RNA helicase
MAEAHAKSPAKQAAEAVPITEPPRPTFESLGLGAAFIRSMQRAYPNLKFPTDTQAQLITAIMGTQDILLKDTTGSGKCVVSIIILIWCLFSTCSGSGRLG